MSLTPVDILHTQFKTTLRGYDKRQVDEFVRAARESLDEAVSEKAELARKVKALQDELDRLHKIESAMTGALTAAQKSADELRANAHRQAEMILQEAEQARVRMTIETQKESEKYRGEIALIEATRDRFEAEFRAVLAGYQEWLDKRRSIEEPRAEVA